MTLKHQNLSRTLFFVLVSIFLASCAHGPKQTQYKTDFTSGEVLNLSYDFTEAGKDMTYALYVPTSYDPSRPTPLVVLLHGLTSNPIAVIGYEGVTEEAEKHGMIVVAPFGYNEGGWYGSRGNTNDFGNRTANMFTEGTPDNLGELSELDVLNVMDIIRKEYNIDSDRTYLVGHSMGGAGTLHLGIKYHQQWAALTLMSPAVLDGPTGPLSNLKDVPLLTIHGDQDELVPVALVRNLVGQFNDAGLENDYIEIPGGDHTRVIARKSETITSVFDFLTKYSK